MAGKKVSLSTKDGMSRIVSSVPDSGQTDTFLGQSGRQLDSQVGSFPGKKITEPFSGQNSSE